MGEVCTESSQTSSRTVGQGIKTFTPHPLLSRIDPRVDLTPTSPLRDYLHPINNFWTEGE